MEKKILSSEVTLNEVQEHEKYILKNLWNLYAHDMSEYRKTIEISEDGTFPFTDDVNKHFNKSCLHSLMIKVNEKIAGFILIAEPPYFKDKCDYCIEELFILRKYRNNGLATMVINRIFELYKGKYWYIILERNKASLSLFKKIHEENNIQYHEIIKNFDEITKCFYRTFIVK